MYIVCISFHLLHFGIKFFRAVKQESPYDRMKHVVKWYLSGFYKKPKVHIYTIQYIQNHIQRCSKLCISAEKINPAKSVSQTQALDPGLYVQFPVGAFRN